MSEVTRSRWIYLVPLIVIVGLVAVFGKQLMNANQGGDPRLIPSVLLNTALPPFELAALPGRVDTRGLKAEDLKGDVTLLNVWASWCVPCLEEHPMLVAIAAEDIVSINGINWKDTPPQGSPEDAFNWLLKNGDPYKRVGVDPDSAAAIALGVQGAPETFIIDKAGVIRYKHIGPITPEVWRTKLEPVIEKLRQ